MVAETSVEASFPLFGVFPSGVLEAPLFSDLEGGFGVVTILPSEAALSLCLRTFLGNLLSDSSLSKVSLAAFNARPVLRILPNTRGFLAVETAVLELRKLAVDSNTRSLHTHN